MPALMMNDCAYGFVIFCLLVFIYTVALYSFRIIFHASGLDVFCLRFCGYLFLLMYLALLFFVYCSVYTILWYITVLYMNIHMVTLHCTVHLIAFTT